MRIPSGRLISPSGISMFRECPYKFLLHYAGARRLPPHPDRREPLEFGRAVHEVIRRYYELLPPEGVTRGTLREVMLRAFQETWPHRLAHLRERAERQLMNFLRFEERRITWRVSVKPVAFEHEYVKPPLHGIVDALFRAPNGELIVVDWKTGRGQARLTEHVVTQMNVYLYLTGASRAYAVFLEWGEWYEIRPTMDVEEIVRAILTMPRYPRRRGPHCAMCEYQLACLSRERIGEPLAFSLWG